MMFKLVVSLLLTVASTLILPEYGKCRPIRDDLRDERLERCDAPLGMESGSIADRALSSSSTHDLSSVGARMSR